MKRQRRSIRLPNYDYSQAGGYFVTICTEGRQCVFGDITDGKMELNDSGRMVWSVWKDLPRYYNDITIDEFVVMPNHVHGILFLDDRAGFKPAPTKKQHGLPEIVRAFKTFSARQINKLRKIQGEPLWQRNYYEHVIRNEYELARIRRYIRDNPSMWVMDGENPMAGSTQSEESWQV